MPSGLTATSTGDSPAVTEGGTSGTSGPPVASYCDTRDASPKLAVLVT
jgi:hypothetical protein